MTETQNIEYKRNWRDEYLKWICGFANANGGTLFIGIDDNGKILGINNHSILLEQLPNKFRDVLGIFAEVNLKQSGNKFYLEINVPRYDVPISIRGRYYIRIGSTLQELTGSKLNEFVLKRTGKTWDDIIEEKASINDINHSSLKKFIEDAKKTKRITAEYDISDLNLLQKLRLVENHKLKRAAIILFGKDPGRFFPNLSVKIGKFGTTDADLKYHDVVEGNLIQLIDNIGKMLNSKFFIHPIDFKGLQRIERDEYPVAAIREMILNALVHRNYLGAPTQIRLYDNSISIWNDGELPEGITEEDLRTIHRSKPRNPIIADVCFKAGYIDSWGRGTIKILEACRQANLPDPIMRNEQNGFLCQIFKDKFSQELLNKMNLNERQIKAVNYLKNTGRMTNSDYIKLNEVSGRTALRDLKDLLDKKIINKHGLKKGTYYSLRND